MQARDEQQIVHIVGNAGRKLGDDVQLLQLRQMALRLFQLVVAALQLLLQLAHFFTQPVFGLFDGIDIRVRAYPVQRLALRTFYGCHGGKEPVILALMLLDAQSVAGGLLGNQRLGQAGIERAHVIRVDQIDPDAFTQIQVLRMVVGILGQGAVQPCQLAMRRGNPDVVGQVI